MCLSVNCQPGKLLINFLCSLPWLLGPNMFCLSRVSQGSLGPNPCHGVKFHLLRLLRHGGLLLRSGGLLLRHGGLLLRSGVLLLRLLRSGGLLLCRGGLLLRSGGLLLCHGDLLLRPGGLLFCLLHPGGLQSHPLRPGGLLFRLLCPALVGSCSVCSALVGPSSVLPALPQSPVSPLPHGPCPLSLPLFHLRSTALLDYIKLGTSGSRSLGGGALSRIRSMNFRSLTTRGHSLTTLNLARHPDYNSHHPLH